MLIIYGSLEILNASIDLMKCDQGDILEDMELDGEDWSLHTC